MLVPRRSAVGTTDESMTVDRGKFLAKFAALFQHIRFRCSDLFQRAPMSLSAMSRRRLLLRSSLTRHSSTSPSSSSPPVSTPTKRFRTLRTQLPPKKMRSLVSLYHQSKGFISPANLSDKIDEVFAKDFYSNGTSFASYWNLVGMVTEREAAPRIGNPRVKEQVELQRWSARPAAKREQMVIDALYGVDEGMPGLDTLLDEEKTIREAAKEDKTLKDSS